MSDIARRYAPMIEQIAEIYSGHPIVRAQLRSLTVIREDWDDDMRGGHFWFDIAALPGTIEDTFDINARADDADGATIDIIIHPVDGTLNWGEWYRLPRGLDDFATRIQQWPPASVRR